MLQLSILKLKERNVEVFCWGFASKSYMKETNSTEKGKIQ